MRTISVWQPWASLLAHAAKRYETRSRPAKPGPLAIHAAATKHAPSLELCLQEPFRSALCDAGIERVRDLPYGAVLALGELVACHRTEDLRGRLDRTEVQFGDFSPGRFAWEIRIDQVFDVPIAAKGSQGFWFWRRPTEAAQ